MGVGFYGNSETNDGVYQLSYSLYNANHTLGGVDSLVSKERPSDISVMINMINIFKIYSHTLNL